MKFCFEFLESTKISSYEPVSSQKYENGYRTKIYNFTVCLNHLRVDECRWKKIAQVILVIACTDYRYKDRSGKRSLRTDEKGLSAGKSLGKTPRPRLKNKMKS